MTSCPECGHSNMPGVAFCDDCGHDLSTVAATIAPSLTPQPDAVASLDTSTPTSGSDPFGDPFGDPFAPTSIYAPPVVTTPPENNSVQTVDTSSSFVIPSSPIPPVASEAQPLTATLKIERNGKIGHTFDISAPTTIGKWDMDSGNFPELDATDHDPDGYISRKHAVIDQNLGQWTITDLGSTNGTALNRQKLAPHQPQPLKSGDELIVGRLFLRFHT